jgi:hypothetical protein
MNSPLGTTLGKSVGSINFDRTKQRCALAGITARWHCRSPRHGQWNYA